MNQKQCYFALDLELNNAQDNSTDNPKIIQVGIAFGTYEDFINQSLKTHAWLLDPQEPILEFITELTGISNINIADHAITHKALAQELSSILKNQNCFINPVTWGVGDSSKLKSEFQERGIAFPHFGRRWIDVKTWYTLHMLAIGKKPSGGLSSALASYKLHFNGRPHHADDDALNTLRLFFEMIRRQRQLYQFVKDAKAIPV